MPRIIGDSFNPGATNALRATQCKGTICCSICKRPAVGIYDGQPLCAYHTRKKYGFLKGVS